MVVFPEGTRSKSGNENLQNVKTGIITLVFGGIGLLIAYAVERSILTADREGDKE